MDFVVTPTRSAPATADLVVTRAFDAIGALVLASAAHGTPLPRPEERPWTAPRTPAPAIFARSR
jgi:hypothetical protein